MNPHCSTHLAAPSTSTLAQDLAALHRAKSGPAPKPSLRAPQEVRFELEARETQWEISPGTSVSAWGYQGSVPGPILVGHVGDVLVVRLTNHLPEPTLIHWHGLRIPAAMDGTESVQRLVQPGETFEYTSWTRIATPQGTMRGTYLCMTEEAQPFEAAVPEFMLARPEQLH